MFFHISHHVFSRRYWPQISSRSTQLWQGCRREWVTIGGQIDRLPWLGRSGAQWWKRGGGGGRGRNSWGSEHFSTCLGVAEEDCSDDELRLNVSCMMSHTSPLLSICWKLGPFLEGKIRYQKMSAACFQLPYHSLDLRHGPLQEGIVLKMICWLVLI